MSQNVIDPFGGVGRDDDGGCEIADVVVADRGPVDATVSSDLLADHTTFHVGGPARRLLVATTQQELIDMVRAADAAGEPLLVLSGGSNVLVGDEGFDGTVVKVATRGIEAEVSSCGGAVVTVQAGERWDEFVEYTISQEWSGIEALSGIPGAVGSTPVQNVGAYGADVSQVVYRVRTLDRVTGEYRTFTHGDCRFSYRDSVFKATRMPDGGPTGRYVVLEVTFQFTLGSLSQPVRYAELARRLGVEVGQRCPATAVRQAVLELRRGKGMVVDEDDHDTWSAGSFFTNPILPADRADALPPDAPRYPAGEGLVKTSAAWLIDHAGVGKGWSVPEGNHRASLSTRHTLALTNRGQASAADIVALARAIQAGVQDRFGVKLVAEPVAVNCSVD